MIKILQKGKYLLVMNKGNDKTIYLDSQGYHWTNAKGIGEILTFCKSEHKLEYVLGEGRYILYQVRNEPKLVDLQHLELSYDTGKFQGYLLLTGLPTRKKLRSRIIATKETISEVKPKKTNSKTK
jgi:hypothetical protein